MKTYFVYGNYTQNTRDWGFEEDLFCVVLAENEEECKQHIANNMRHPTLDTVAFGDWVHFDHSNYTIKEVDTSKSGILCSYNTGS